MYVVSVESKGVATPIMFGATFRSFVDAAELARSLSGGIGRDTITLQTVAGPQVADAVWVSSLLNGRVARFVDGETSMAGI